MVHKLSSILSVVFSTFTRSDMSMCLITTYSGDEKDRGTNHPASSSETKEAQEKERKEGWEEGRMGGRKEGRK
jgi:hypothetical protein